MTELTLTRRQLNAVITHANREISKADQLRSAESLSAADISASMAKLNSYQTRILEYTDKILTTALDADALDDEIERYESIKDNLIESIAKLRTALLRSAQEENASDERRSEDNLGQVSNFGDRRDVSVRLPKLELAKFSGDPMKFQEFWDTFDTTIHQNPKLAPIEKFKYLRSYLDGSALVLAEGYGLTNANYETVIQVLKERFGDPELAIFCHLDALLAVPLAGTKAHDLRNTYDECDCHIRSLVGLGMPEATFGRVYVPIILSKLPTPVRITLHQKKGTGVCWTLPELREMIRTEIYAREMGSRAFGGSVTKDGQSKDKAASGLKHGWQPSASALSASATSKNPIICSFCSGDHYSDRCQKFPDLDSRRRAIGSGCFVCLRKGHSAGNCRNKRPCFFCKRDSHNRSLCPKQFGKDKKGKPAPGTEAKPATTGVMASDVSATLVSNGKRGILQTALAEICGRTGTVKARLLLDVGSDNSFATNSVLKKIGAHRTGTDIVGLAGFQTTKRSLTSSPIHEISVSLKDGSSLKLDVYGTNAITCPIEKPAVCLDSHPILRSLPLAEPISDSAEPVSIDILIGSDHYYDIVKQERIALDEDLLLLGSELGYILAGRVRSRTAESNAFVASLARTSLLDSRFELERFWKLEELGIKDLQESSDDQRALDAFNSSVKFDSSTNRYEVKWPWKPEIQEPSSNFGLAFGRLKSLRNRLKENRAVWEKYQSAIDDQLASGVIEVAPEQPDGEVVHYLPHHGVLKPDKATTKLRIVFDASCRANKQAVSLNDCMYRGPVMLRDLCGLLLRFRLSRVAVVSDLEKAFLQIGLQAPDRDAVRFLWLRSPDKQCSSENVISFRFKRVCFGVVSSPFLLAATIAHLLNKDNSPTARAIAKAIYVDNIIGGVGSATEALEYYSEAKRIFSKASMNLREFFSNDSSFITTIPQNDRGKGPDTKVLGILWNTNDDTLGVSTGRQASPSAVTKRTVLRQIAQIFDPCGLFAPIVIIGKILMQEIWQAKHGWDDKLPEAMEKKWKQFQEDCRMISSFRIPRYIGSLTSLKADKVSIHCFCDASAKAYCAASYLRLQYEGDAIVFLIFAKSRVAPLERQTIPRLELLAIWIGAKLVKYLEEQLDLQIDETTIWSDSQCALSWVIRTPAPAVFVRNRVKTIKELKNTEFRFVRSEENPADLATRGESFSCLANTPLWWNGPQWLQGPKQSWPEMPIIADEEPEKGVLVTISVVEAPPVRSVFDPGRASTIGKLERTVAYVFRFIGRALKRTGTEPDTLTASELQRAKMVLVGEAQRREFANVFNKSTAKDRNLVSQLGLFKDNLGIIRCSGRLQNSTLPLATKNPILLPKRDSLTTLVIADCHSRLHHAGLKHTLSELRYQYWVVNGRSEVKRVLGCCHVCRWLKGGPFRAPPEPALPGFRVREGKAFSSVGVDYLGPLTFYSGSGSASKCWIVLFTCTTSRAIHLEVTTSMTAEDFLLGFRRFIASYGCPQLVVSDNAKAFVTAEKVLKKAWIEVLRHPEVERFSLSNGIRWKFLVELAPWTGGFYERLVGLVKKSLRAALHLKRVSLAQLQTVVAEIATILNTRPLVYSEDEVGDFALTPAHLTMRHHSLFPLPAFVGDPDYCENATTPLRLLQGWQRLQKLLDSFWHSWRRQYLTSLRERANQQQQRNVADVVPWPGMLVLVGDKRLPRGMWQVGRVVDVGKSSDGEIRFVRVKTTTGKTLRRPVKLLYPLEISNHAATSQPLNMYNECSENAQTHLSTDKSKSTEGEGEGSHETCAEKRSEKAQLRSTGRSKHLRNMSRFVGATLTHSGHPLSRNYNHFSGLQLGQCRAVGEIRVPTLAVGYAFVMARQHELCNNLSPVYSEKLLRDAPKLSSLAMVDNLLGQTFQMDPSWIRLSGDVYYSIIAHLLAQHWGEGPKDGFSEAFLQTVEDHRVRNTVPKYLHCKPNDTVFSGGVRLGTANKFIEKGDLQLTGANAWGELLDVLGDELNKGQIESRWSMDKLMNVNLYSHLCGGSSRTGLGILLLTDSYGKYIEKVTGGHVIRQSGGTFGSLATAIEETQTGLSDFDYIIISCGFNDCQLSSERQRKSWEDFEKVIGPEIARRVDDAQSILFSLPFEHPSYRSEIRSYLLFIERQIARYPVSVHKWSDGCPFINPYGGLRNEFFDSDKLHLNHHGFRKLWLEWSKPLAGLEFHAVKLSAKPYVDNETVKSVRKEDTRVVVCATSSINKHTQSAPSTSSSHRHHPYSSGGRKRGGR